MSRFRKMTTLLSLAVALSLVFYLPLTTSGALAFFEDPWDPPVDTDPLCTPPQDLMANGGFEMPVVNNNFNWDIFPSDPNDDLGSDLLWGAEWMPGVEGAPEIANVELQRTPLMGWSAQEGDQWTELDTDWYGPESDINGEPASIRLIHNVGTIAGCYYKLEFYTSPRPGRGTDDNAVEISWDGAVIDSFSEDGLSLNQPDWTHHHQYIVQADDMISELSFADTGIPNSYGMLLDNVQIHCIAIPVPVIEKDGEYDPSTGQLLYTLNWGIYNDGELDNVVITDELPEGTTYVEGSASDGGSYNSSTRILTWNIATPMPPNPNEGFVTYSVWVDGAFASSVVDSDQGDRKDGSDVLPGRSNPDAALGYPQSTGVPADPTWEESWFFSLGFPTEKPAHEASITLEFNQPFLNGPDNDLKVYEVTGGQYPIEKAEVFAKQALEDDWTSLGVVEQDNTVDLGALPSASYVKLVDVSNKAEFPNDADGYDVDAVLALYPGICSITNYVEITGDVAIEGWDDPSPIPPVWDDDTEITAINEYACVPELSIQKRGVYDPETGEITYAIHWEVNGSGTLYNATVKDTMPAGTEFESSNHAPADVSGGVVTWVLGDQPAGTADTITLVVSVISYDPWADAVVDYQPGQQKDGGALPGDRDDPALALGPDTDTDAAPPNFVSLGFGGTLILQFNNYIVNEPGDDDIHIIETSYGDPPSGSYPEAVEVFASPNGVTWLSLGTEVRNVADEHDNDFDLGILPWARYIKLVDVSDPQGFSDPNADGYDVAAVEALHTAPAECSLDNLVVLTGMTQWQEELSADASITTDINEFACSATITGHKFNDWDNDSNWDQGEPGEPGMSGWTIKAVLPEPTVVIEVPSNNPDGIDTPTLPAGRYLAVVTGDWQGAQGEQNRVDAEYLTHDSWTTHQDGGGVGTENQGDLMVNNDFLEWGPYSGMHDYYHNFTLEEDGTLNFSVFDGDAGSGTKNPDWYADNIGALTVTLYAVVDETVTDGEGLYTLNIPGGISSTWVFEIPQVGWTQTYPLQPNFWPVDLSQDKSVTDKNFGNHGDPGYITGVKFNDEDNNGEWDKGESGLGGWTIYAGKLVDELNVDSYNDAEDGASVASDILENGQKYFMRASGTFGAGDSITADAQYSKRSDPNVWTDLVENYGGYGVELLDLLINEEPPRSDDWGSFNTGNVYWRTFMGDGGPAYFHIHDIYAYNNNGALNVKIYKVLAETVTNEDGSYTLDLPDEAYGDIVVAEETQDGWVQTYPMPEGYHVVPAYGWSAGINFGNHDTTIPPRSDGSIAGIKFNDLHQTATDGIKDEGENPLSGWKIYLDEGETPNGIWDEGEPYYITDDVTGAFSFTGLTAGTYIVREVAQGGWVQTWPGSQYSNGYELTIGDGTQWNWPDTNFGNYHGIVEQQGTTGGGGGYYTPPTAGGGGTGNEAAGGEQQTNPTLALNDTNGAVGGEQLPGAGTPTFVVMSLAALTSLVASAITYRRKRNQFEE